MKKLFLAAAFIGCLSMRASAFQSTVWLSSNTAVAVSTSTSLCQAEPSGSFRGVLHGVCINTAAAGSVQVFNSSGTAANTITGVLNTGTQEPCNYYDVAIDSGIAVNKVGTADITILYQCY
jgi:hypothetical protein